MTSKQRVYAAIQRKPADRIPVFMWFHPETRTVLAEFLGVPESRIDEVMFNDIRQVWVGNNFAMEGVSLNEGEEYLDFWGIRWRKEGPFNQIIEYPLFHADETEISEYDFPHGQIIELVNNLSNLEGEFSEYFIGCDISPCLFEMYNRLRGMENALADIALIPETFTAFMEKSTDHSLALAKDAVGRFSLDWLWTGDDVGGQNALMMNPKAWREMIKPQLKRLFDFGKSRNLWVAHHSCGSVRSIIGDLVEIGLDVLNPIQSNCPGMNPYELKKEFGDRLTFMGGIDTQYLLPNGTALDVQNEVGRIVEIMSSGGGYILAASHTVPPETPLENIFAMYEAVGITREMILDKAGDVRNILKKFKHETG